MALEKFLVWRCARIEGGKDMAVDFLSEDAAERHAVWVARKSTEQKTFVAHVYAVTIWPDEGAA